MELKRLKLVGKEEDVIEVREEDIVSPYDSNIQIRAGGEFDRKGYLLTSSYDWVIGEDSLGRAVLLALRKKP